MQNATKCGGQKNEKGHVGDLLLSSHSSSAEFAWRSAESVPPLILRSHFWFSSSWNAPLAYTYRFKPAAGGRFGGSIRVRNARARDGRFDGAAADLCAHTNPSADAGTCAGAGRAQPALPAALRPPTRRCPRGAARAAADSASPSTTAASRCAKVRHSRARRSSLQPPPRAPAAPSCLSGGGLTVPGDVRGVSSLGTVYFSLAPEGSRVSGVTVPPFVLWGWVKMGDA